MTVKSYGLLPQTLIKFAMNADMTTDIHDPRNAGYLKPLPEADEDMARGMAKAIYSGEPDDQQESRQNRAI